MNTKWKNILIGSGIVIAVLLTEFWHPDDPAVLDALYVLGLLFCVAVIAVFIYAIMD